jgi:inorganic pyrophosphatase
LKIENIPAFVKKSSREVHAIIETPRGSQNKYDYDPKHSLFGLGTPLPPGFAFPHDFGFIPSTLGDDGDPIDVLVLMDDRSFPGCLVKARLIGVFEAEESNKSGAVRNDRLVAVASESYEHRDTKKLRDIPQSLRKGIVDFFVAYNRERGKEFRFLAERGPATAEELVRKGIRKRKKR